MKLDLEQRYEDAARLINRPVQWLKDIDADGPECESGMPVCECILQDCPALEHCHFKPWWK